MNKAWQIFHRLIGCKKTEEVGNKLNPDSLKRKIMLEKHKDIQKLKQTNGIIKVMIEKGELELRITKK
jgi:hypothetical protein